MKPLFIVFMILIFTGTLVTACKPTLKEDGVEKNADYTITKSNRKLKTNKTRIINLSYLPIPAL